MFGTPPPASAAVHAALDLVSSTIAVASGLADAGRAVDLTGLDCAAGTLCAQILDLPPQEGFAFRAALIELDAKIATLSSVIRGAA